MSRAPQGRLTGSGKMLFRRIGVRFLAVHLLLLFLPVGALVVFDRYEQQLLQQQEEAMVQQARLAVAALEKADAPLEGRATQLIERFAGANVARLRILDRSASVLGDTSEPMGESESEAVASTGSGPGASVPDTTQKPPTRERLLYRLGAFPFRMARTLQETGYGSQLTPVLAERDEVFAALGGHYGARARTDGDRLLLHVALPIRGENGVEGAVLVSRSTDRIRARVYELRLFLFRVFLASVALAIVVNLLLAGTIERPLRRLRAEANDLLDRRGKMRGDFSASDRLDEIGDLTRSLHELAGRLRRQQRRTEEFVADLSHELKNPLAAIRTTVDLDPSLESDASGETVERNVARMERMISELAELSRLEAGTPEVEQIDVAEVTRHVVEAWSQHANHSVDLRSSGPLLMDVDPEHVTRILINLLDNAAHHSPQGTSIEVDLFVRSGRLNLHVRDHGCGIADGEDERIFERFYSRRKKRTTQDPTSLAPQGLGLAMVRALAETNGGGARACPKSALEGDGARLEVWLPTAL